MEATPPDGVVLHPSRVAGHHARLRGVGGAVELIIAGIALKAGLFNHPDPPPPIIEHMFSAVVIMAVVTTLVPPIALRFLLGDDTTTEGEVPPHG